MGQLLAKYYQFVQAESGLQARMRLAMMTGVPSNKADETPDSPEMVAKFKKAVQEITGKQAPA